MNHKCLICNSPMKLSKTFSPHKLYSGAYRRRRYECTYCEYSEMICADGEIDLIHSSQKAIEDIKEMFKQEQLNRM